MARQLLSFPRSGTHDHQGFGYHWPATSPLLRRTGPRLRGDDSRESLLHIFGGRFEKRFKLILSCSPGSSGSNSLRLCPTPHRQPPSSVRTCATGPLPGSQMIEAAEAALRAEGKLLERQVAARLVDPPIQEVGWLEVRPLGGDEPEHRHRSLRTCLSGSNPPERSSSYSSRMRWCLSCENTCSAMPS